MNKKEKRGVGRFWLRVEEEMNEEDEKDGIRWRAHEFCE